ncbi:hypothetical protein FSHL1_000001 [Fusarium sambucinum]
MEGLGAAANIITVIDLSAKVATLCFQYCKDVCSAREDIERVRNQVDHLATALGAAKHLVEGTRSPSLPTSQHLSLDPSGFRTTMRRYGGRALKWPFNNKEVNQLLDKLGRHERTILLGLQVDQTAILVDINDGVKQLWLRGTEDVLTSSKPHLMVPFTPNLNFIHRPEIETWIQDQYRQPSQRMALVGMGGFGKSQLAIHFAHDVYMKETGTSVFWVHSSSKAAFDESYRTLADVLMLPRRHEPEVNVLALVRDWLQKDDVRPWLMVVDNADDINLFNHGRADANASQGPLASYLPKSTKGKILVTSRSLDVAERLVGSSRATLRIPVMGEEQASELLQRTLEDKADESTAVDLVRTLNHIPLAINQAAAYINRRSPQVTVTSYLDEICRSEKRKDSLLRSDKGDLSRQDGVSNSVVLTWQVTLEQIKRDQPRAASLLSLMSQFQAQNIPEFMLHGYDDNETRPDDEDDETNISNGSESGCESERISFENDMDVLRGYCLVTITAAGLYEMHPLVQLCTRSWISEFGDPTRWSQLFTKLAAEYFPSGDFETWEICQSLLPHIESLLKTKPREERVVVNWTEILIKVSRYMRKIGEYSRSEMLARTAVQTRTNILGPDYPNTLTSVFHLASTYSNQGRWEEAEQLEVEVMEAFRTNFGFDHPKTLVSMANFATHMGYQGRLDEAKMLVMKVMEIRKAKLGLNHPDALISISNYAAIFWAQDRFEEAEKLQVEVLEAHKAMFGLKHPDTLISRDAASGSVRDSEGNAWARPS